MNSSSEEDRSDKWSVRVGPGNAYQSAFADGTTTISLGILRTEWESWGADERLRFVLAYTYRPSVDLEDQRILEFLLGEEDKRIHEMLAILLLSYPDEEWALRKLCDLATDDSYNRLNFLQALSLMEDPRAGDAITEVYRDAARKLLKPGGEIHETRAQELVYSTYLLAKRTGAPEYWSEFENYERHQNKHLREEAIRLRKLGAALDQSRE